MSKSDVNIPFEIKDDWFNEHHVKHITQEFIDWWIGYYGVPMDYDSREIIDEYYIRMAFALSGWRAKESNNNAI